MDVGADNFHFALEDQNGRKLPVQPVRQPCTTELHVDSLDRYLTRSVQNGPYIYVRSQNTAKLAGPILLDSGLNATGYVASPTLISNQAADPCIIQTARPLSYGYYSRIALTQFFLKFQMPTFSPGYNNVFLIYWSTSPNTIGGTLSVSIPYGFYTYATAATAIQASMRALPNVGGQSWAGATVTPPALPGDGFGIATGSAGLYMAIAIDGPAAAVTPPGSDSIQTLNLRTGRNLGFNREMYGYTPEANIGGQSQTPTLWTSANGGPPNFLVTDYVDIVSQTLSNYKDAKDTNTSESAPMAVIGRIWLTENSVDQAGTLGFDTTEIGSGPISLVKNWQHPNWSKWSPNQSVDKIDITLLDMFGYPIYWSSDFQTEWSMTLTLTE